MNNIVFLLHMYTSTCMQIWQFWPASLIQHRVLQGHTRTALKWQSYLAQVQIDDEATSRAKEAAEPLKRWWQSKQSSSPTNYFTSQEQDIPGGHVSHTEESHQSSGQGTTNTSSAQHETSSWSNDNNSYDSGYQQGNQLQQQRQPVGTLCLAQQLLCVTKLACGLLEAYCDHCDK